MSLIVICQALSARHEHVKFTPALIITHRGAVLCRSCTSSPTRHQRMRNVDQLCIIPACCVCLCVLSTLFFYIVIISRSPFCASTPRAGVFACSARRSRSQQQQQQWQDTVHTSSWPTDTLERLTFIPDPHLLACHIISQRKVSFDSIAI